MAAKMTEEQIEVQSIAQVFSLGGGELNNDASFAGYAYWFEGYPEWAGPDFDVPLWDSENDFRTVIVTGGGFLPNPKDALEHAGETWKLVKAYSFSGESDCPFLGCNDANTVTRESARLVSTYKSKRKQAECPFCEERVGSKHTVVYVGESYEAVYRRVAEDRADDDANKDEDEEEV